MKTKSIALATLLFTAATGSAFAGGFAPASGEGPLFQTEVAATSNVSREAVRAEAAQKSLAALTPRRHPDDAFSTMSLKSTPTQTRAEVRAQTREALAHGVKLSVGEQS